MPDKIQEIHDILKYGRVAFKPSYSTGRDNSVRAIVVGCGGTGSRLIPLLAQHIANHNYDITRIGHQSPFGKMHLILVDMDIVETKNLKRQNFYAFDVGKHKAVCLAERFSALYGIDIDVFTTPFDSCRQAIQNNSYGNTIFFDCTDNKAARESIEKYNNISTIISCGNEDIFGQVFVGTTSSTNKRTYQSLKALMKIDRQIANPKCDAHIDDDGNCITIHNSLPTFLQTFKTFKDTETLSCTEMVLQNEQSMPINSLVAQLAYNVFYTLISCKPLAYNMVKCSIDNQYHTHFISNPLKFRSLYFKAMFGIECPEAEAALNAIRLKIEGAYNLRFSALESFITEHGVFALPLMKTCLEHSYMINGDEAVKLTALVIEKERELRTKMTGE